jgi:Arc/MetJ-type ribon-helix-helix transcriptional regulator
LNACGSIPSRSTKKELETMHQDSPNIKIVGVKMTQELYRKVEKRVAERQMKDVSQLVRFLVMEDLINVALTAEDKAIIAARKSARKSKGGAK